MLGVGGCLPMVELKALEYDTLSQSPALSPSDAEDPGCNMSYFWFLGDFGAVCVCMCVCSVTVGVLSPF